MLDLHVQQLDILGLTSPGIVYTVKILHWQQDRSMRSAVSCQSGVFSRSKIRSSTWVQETVLPSIVERSPAGILLTSLTCRWCRNVVIFNLRPILTHISVSVIKSTMEWYLYSLGVPGPTCSLHGRAGSLNIEPVPTNNRSG